MARIRPSGSTTQASQFAHGRLVAVRSTTKRSAIKAATRESGGRGQPT